MAFDERRGAGISIIFLRDVNLQKAYTLGSEVAGKAGAIFNGVNVYTFASNPPRDRQSLNFFGDPAQMETIVSEVTKGLGLLPMVDFLVTAWPTSQFVPKTRPQQTST